MINFAFCYEHKNVLEFVKNEVVKCLNQKGIIVAVKCYHSAYELQRCIQCNCPDILFYDIEAEDGLMRQIVMEAKRINKKLVSVTTHGHDYCPPVEDILLEPLYVLPDKSRRHLWAYTTLAYERLLDDEDSFTYYVRPCYVHIPVNAIHYFASEGRRTHMVSSGRRDMFYKKLDNVEALVKNKNCHFLRIHKSYLVNARYISGYSRDYVFLTTGERLRISRYEYYKRINDQMQHLKQKRRPHYQGN